MSEGSLLVLCGVGMFLSGVALFRDELARKERRLTTLRRFRMAVGTSDGARSRSSGVLRLSRLIRRRLWAAGIEARERHLWVWAVGGSTALVLAWFSAGIAGLVISMVGAIGGTHVVLEVRAGFRRSRILEQLPGLIEQLVRMISVGATLAVAIQEAARETAEPLGQVLRQLERQLLLGAELDDALDRATEGIGLRELDMIALAVRVHQRYGGGVAEMLRSVGRTVRERDRVQREFRAMTAETRASALILASLPAALAAYVMFLNPGYLSAMWSDASGQRLLLAAIGLHVSGSFLLWRMVRST